MSKDNLFESLYGYTADQMAELVFEAEYSNAILSTIRHFSRNTGEDEVTTLRRMVVALDNDYRRILNECVRLRGQLAFSKPISFKEDKDE